MITNYVHSLSPFIFSHSLSFSLSLSHTHTHTYTLCFSPVCFLPPPNHLFFSLSPEVDPFLSLTEAFLAGGTGLSSSIIFTASLYWYSTGWLPHSLSLDTSLYSVLLVTAFYLHSPTETINPTVAAWNVGRPAFSSEEIPLGVRNGIVRVQPEAVVVFSLATGHTSRIFTSPERKKVESLALWAFTGIDRCPQTSKTQVLKISAILRETNCKHESKRSLRNYP